MWWCCKLYLDTFIQKLFHTFHRVYSHNNCWRSDIVLQSALVVGSHLKWKCINKLNYMLQLNQEYSKKNIDKAHSMIIFKQKCHGKYKISFQCIRSTLYVYYSYTCHRLKSGYDAPVYEPINDMLENFFIFFSQINTEWVWPRFIANHSQMKRRNSKFSNQCLTEHAINIVKPCGVWCGTCIIFS